VVRCLARREMVTRQIQISFLSFRTHRFCLSLLRCTRIRVSTMELGFPPSRRSGWMVPNLSQRSLFLRCDGWWSNRTLLRSIHLETDRAVVGGEVGGEEEARRGRWVRGERWVRTSVTWGTCTRLVGRKPRRADRDAISTASFAPGLSHVWIDSRCSSASG